MSRAVPLRWREEPGGVKPHVSLDPDLGPRSGQVQGRQLAQRYCRVNVVGRRFGGNVNLLSATGRVHD